MQKNSKMLSTASHLKEKLFWHQQSPIRHGDCSNCAKVQLTYAVYWSQNPIQWDWGSAKLCGTVCAPFYC